MRIPTEKKLKRLEDVLVCAYVQNIREPKIMEDRIAMNDKLARISKLALGRRAIRVPDMALDALRRMDHAKTK